MTERPAASEIEKSGFPPRDDRDAGGAGGIGIEPKRPRHHWGRVGVGEFGEWRPLRETAVLPISAGRLPGSMVQTNTSVKSSSV